MLVKKSRTLQNDEKWSICENHEISDEMQYLIIFNISELNFIELQIWYQQSKALIELNRIQCSRSRELIRMQRKIEISENHQIFNRKITIIVPEILEAQPWTDNKTITISSVLSHCRVENCAELIWTIGFREKLKLDAGGKPSTWLPPGRLVEPSQFIGKIEIES